MNKQEAAKLISETFQNPFDEGRFRLFAINLFNDLDETKTFDYYGQFIPDAYKDHVKRYKRVGKYTDPEGAVLDVLIVNLKKEAALDRARTMQRNFIAWYLKKKDREAAIVAYHSDEMEDWRFSYVRMDYRTVEEKGKVKVKEELTPARRYSFLVGKNEPNHTAQQQLLPILQEDRNNPTLSELERAFNIESVTKEFFERYKNLFLKLKDELDTVVERDRKVREDFASKKIETADFAKKLLGQIVFLYFLQKKGWLGVEKDKDGNFKGWGSGPKGFLRQLFDKRIVAYDNFFNDLLEPLFYEALAIDRGVESFYSPFKCKIPFLNGGLFEPICGYNWQETDILIRNEVFALIFDTFDLYNFTVREDEPLEKEVAVDPEMLGKVFENLLEVKDRKSKGAFYTPREIVHYMCQESLINYLDTAVNTRKEDIAPQKHIQRKLFGAPEPEQLAIATVKHHKVIPREEIECFIRHGEFAIEHDRTVEAKGRETRDYQYHLPESIRLNARLIDKALADIKICDIAIGSGAFPVGILHEIVTARETLTAYIGKSSERTRYDFKRHAIQESIYGVDIDASAVDIAKLRLWLSLVVDEEDFETIKPLPNLDYKIVCGNSLFGVKRDLLNNHLFKELEALKQQFFDETNPRKKKEEKEEIGRLIKQITNNDEHFDFEIYFSEVFHQKGGFDIVIGNPPYVLLQNIELDKRQLDRLLNKYYAAQYKVDTYHLFIEQGINILSNVGILSFITPNTFLKNKYTNKLREILINRTLIRNLLLFYVKVFNDPSVDNVIIICQKGKNGRDIETHKIKIHDIRSQDFETDIQTVRFYPQMNIKAPDFMFEVDLSESVSLLIAKLDKGSKPFRQIGKSYFGIQTFDRNAFVSNSAKNAYFKPVIDGTNIRRYALIPPSEYLDYRPENIKSGGDPNVYNRDRIVVRQIGKYPDGCLCPKGMFTLNTVYNLYITDHSFDIRYILGLLNSKVSQFYWLARFYDNKETFPKIKKIPLESIPIKIVNRDLQTPVITLVDQILTAKQKDPKADTSALERQIDEMVYGLYGLTEEEIAVVEGKG